MAVADLLEKIGEGAKTVGRVAGAVAEPLAKRTAEVISGEAPEIDQDKRARAEKLEDEQLAARASILENSLAMGQKYGTLTSDQQQQYVDEIMKIYSNARHAPTLMEKLRKAIHPDGTFAQAPQKTLENPTPEGGTLHADTLAAMMRAKPNLKNFRNKDTGETVTWDVNKGELGPEWILTGTASGIPRSLGFGVGVQDAIKSMQTTNQQYLKPDGTPYTAAELAALPPTMQLRAFSSGGQVYYGIADQTQHTVTLGNVIYKMDQFGDIDTTQPQGVARVGSTSTQTAPGGGQVVTATTKPNVAGALTGAKPVSPTAPPSATGARPVNPGALNSIPRTPPTGAQPQSILPNIQGMTPQNAQMAQKAQPAVTALLGLYGDPQNPGTPSMMDYAKLADDPHAQKTLGEAFKLLDQQMGEISDPGVLQTLGTAAGWANFRAQAESGAQQAAGTQMTPQERAYFDASIASMADIIGSRAATGQSAARFSVRAIQNELPLIGLSGTPDSASYWTKMQTIGRQIRVGLNAMPDNVRAMAWLNRREADIAKQKSSVAAAMGGGPVVVSPEELQNATGR